MIVKYLVKICVVYFKCNIIYGLKFLVTNFLRILKLYFILVSTNSLHMPYFFFKFCLFFLYCYNRIVKILSIKKKSTISQIRYNS